MFGTNIIPNMLAQAARGEMDPEDAVAAAESQIQSIFDRWRSQGLVGWWDGLSAGHRGSHRRGRRPHQDLQRPPAPAVDHVDLATEEGEYLVLLGPSGCGKTTLLRMIAGLEQPTVGEVRIDGDLVNGLPPRARRIAMVFQSYALYPHKTVRQNIVFPLKAEKLPTEKRDEKVAWAAELLGLAHLLDRRPRQLSGGERQRVALARALVREPSVFLLDEPLSNLDAKLRAVARDDLKDFHERVGTTTIYVTHDQVEAMGMGDRIVVMLDGEVRQVGPPQAVYERPADTFVATFLGSPPMNLIPRGDDIVGFRPEKALPAGVLGGGLDDHLPWTLEVQPHRVPLRRPSPSRSRRPGWGSRRQSSSGSRPRC